MADLPISGLPAITVPNSSYLLAAVSASVTSQMTLAQVAAAISSSFTASYTPTLQQVLNSGAGAGNFAGGSASIQLTNFVNGRTLYINNNSFPTIKMEDNVDASNNLTIDLNTLTLDNVSYNWSDIVSSTFPYTGSAIISGSLNVTGSVNVIGGITGSIAATNGVISGSSQLTTSFPSKTTGNWTVPAGASTQSFTVEPNSSYTMWVNGNIPNGIITWNATATLGNTNVPVVGAQYGWYYVTGNALVLTSMPNQFAGISGSILTTPSDYAPNTSNVFNFGITNNSGTSQTINYGYIKLS